VVLGAYFATGLLLLLKVFDWGVRRTLIRALAIPREQKQEAKLTPWLATRLLVAAGLRVGIVAAVALPVVMASVMTYRPKVAPAENPKSELGFDYQRVEFRSTDGVKLVGWWIPAADRHGSVRHDPDWGKNTVLVCHGLAASKANQLILARQLVPGGFNVLAFDFRAHGESGGQLSTFGDLERRDVLGAVRWVQQKHPESSRKIFGVGASMGGAALIAAAADPSPEGRSIQAVATYAAYDSLGSLARRISDDYFVQPLGWLLLHVGVPVASAQTGVNLAAFSPGKLAWRIWPRPILLIHGKEDEVIPFGQGTELYQQAALPKYYLWIARGTHNDIIANDSAAHSVLLFFRASRAIPVI
jgi:alpha-beta hydrolase superfamily lysophospholipase